MKKIIQNFIIELTILSLVLISTLAELTRTCLYPPCRFNVYRDDEDNGNVIVNDASSHSISWNWEVRGGKWNVTYQHTYPGGWYEGLVTFINCSNILNGKEQPFVSWGSSKNWESNAKLIFANAWNISYNADVFGFIPTENGKYVFQVFTRNKRHNPFQNEMIVLPKSCNFQSSDTSQIKMWWADRNNRYSCPESDFTWSWNTNLGKWRVVYKWVPATDRISCSVYYKVNGRNEENVINWNLDIPQNLVAYKTNPVKIIGEPAWKIDLSPSEVWGFSPTDQGKWVFQHFSRNLKFQPIFDDVIGK